MPLDKAFDIIRHERGKHFDPDVYNVFFGVPGHVLAADREFKHD